MFNLSGKKLSKGRPQRVRNNLKDVDPEYRSITADIKKFGFALQREIGARLTGDKQNINAPFKTTQYSIHGGNRNLIEIKDEMISNLPMKEPTQLTISTVSAQYLLEHGVAITNDSRDPYTFGSLNDIRMGSSNSGEACGKCASYDCTGHVGYITLKTPVIDPIRWRVVISVLQSICNSCSATILDMEETMKDPAIARLSGGDRLSAIADRSAGRHCTEKGDTIIIGGQECVHEKNPLFQVKESNGKNYVVAVYGDETRHISPQQIFDRFDLLPDNVVRFLGFNHGSHPRDLIIQVLGVPPPVARPAIKIDDEYKSDKLTEKYAAIVAENNKWGKPKQKPEVISANLYDLILQVKSAQDNTGKKSAKGGSIADRLKKKEGIIRNNMWGKRTNYITRGVISPMTGLRFGEIGVPLAAAKTANIPETITPANYQYISDLFKAGRINNWTPSYGPHKGHKITVTPDSLVEFHVGDEVERWLQDGDPVVFNRQPTLHRPSMLGYSARILDDDDDGYPVKIDTKQRRTIGVHPSSTAPHNADFDGDTANLMFPRELKSREEALTKMHAIFNMISETQSKPLVGMIMDSITSAYLLTRPAEGVDPFIFTEVIAEMSTLVNIPDLQARAALYGLHPLSGRTLFSALFPRDFFYRKGDVIIVDGILLAGRITSSHVGATHRSIIQDIHKVYGQDRAADFITDATWLLVAWLDTYGFGIGPVDCEYGQTEQSQQAKREEFEALYTNLLNLSKIPDDPLEAKRHEEEYQKALDHIKEFGKNLALENMGEDEKSLIFGRQNAIGVMASDSGGGGKGNLHNIGQIGGAVGQQFYDSVRMPLRFLPIHPFRDDKSTEAPPEERGYVKSSYWEGLSPGEIIATLWGGRQGLVDTSNATAAVGTFQRDLSKAVEGLLYGDDGTIRSVKGTIYACSYGGDNLDAAHLLNVKTSEYGSTYQVFDAKSLIEKINAEEGWIKEEYFEKIQDNVNMQEFVQRDLDRDVSSETMGAVGEFTSDTSDYKITRFSELLANYNDQRINVEKFIGGYVEIVNEGLSEARSVEQPEVVKKPKGKGVKGKGVRAARVKK